MPVRRRAGWSARPDCSRQVSTCGRTISNGSVSPANWLSCGAIAVSIRSSTSRSCARTCGGAWPRTTAASSACEPVSTWTCSSPTANAVSVSSPGAWNASRANSWIAVSIAAIAAGSRVATSGGAACSSCTPPSRWTRNRCSTRNSIVCRNTISANVRPVRRASQRQRRLFTDSRWSSVCWIDCRRPCSISCTDLRIAGPRAGASAWPNALLSRCTVACTPLPIRSPMLAANVGSRCSASRRASPSVSLCRSVNRGRCSRRSSAATTRSRSTPSSSWRSSASSRSV